MGVAEKLPERFTEAEAAAELGKSVITLRRYRKAGVRGIPASEP